MIPDALRPIVERALQAAFGTTAIDDVAPVAGGMRSALACRVVVAGRPYFVRIGATTLVDPAVELANTRAAAAAGLAPRVWYGNAADHILVADFVARAPLPRDFASIVGAKLARVHALPQWPKTIHFLTTLELFLKRMQRSDADDVLARYVELAAVYPRDADIVACHNDLKPQNLIFDGERLWLVDWEAAFGNDRYADLAIVASFFEAHEDTYLGAYFRAPPTDYQRARFYLARCATHLSYVAFLTVLAARAGVTAQPTPDFRAFHDGLITGAIELADDACKLQYANAHLAAARAATSSPRFAEALAVVRGG